MPETVNLNRAEKGDADDDPSIKKAWPSGHFDSLIQRGSANVGDEIRKKGPFISVIGESEDKIG